MRLASCKSALTSPPPVVYSTDRSKAVVPVLRRANLSAFRTFVRLVLVWICQSPLPLGIWEGLRFVIVPLPGLFSYML